MYDRLGELLNETLEAGEIRFIKVDSEGDFKTNDENVLKKESPKKNQESNPLKSSSAGEDSFFYKNESEKTEQAKVKHQKPKISKHYYIYKTITPEVSNAYRLLDLRTTDSLDDVKKAYKEKLKYFHPDRYEDNAVLKKIATDKTQQIVEAYKLLNEFLSK